MQVIPPMGKKCSYKAKENELPYFKENDMEQLKKQLI